MSESNAYIAQRSNKRNSPFLPLKSAKIWRYIINFAQMFLYSRSKPTKKLLEWGPILNIQLHQIFHFLFPLWLHFFPNTQIPSEYQPLLSLLLVLLEVKFGQSIDFWTSTFFNSFDLVLLDWLKTDISKIMLLFLQKYFSHHNAQSFEITI